MLNPRVASRYAKAILDLAVEKGELEQVFADMQYLQSAMKSSPEFAGMLKSPVVHADTKNKVFQAVSAGKISEMTMAFTRLLITKTREMVLPEVITSFIQQYKKYKNIHSVKLTTALPVSDGIKNSIIAQVKKTPGMENVELETVIDPDIIGGFVLQTGDQLVDASISYELKMVAREFEKNDFVYKVR
jgi:F-type H+-transporting ATPase subunit delta